MNLLSEGGEGYRQNHRLGNKGPLKKHARAKNRTVWRGKAQRRRKKDPGYKEEKEMVT